MSLHEHQPCVYILTNPTRTVLYIGVTSDIDKRTTEHTEKAAKGFTQKYNCIHLVHYEFYETMEEAILREKQLKKWKREWKDDLIIQHNPQWRDLRSL